MADNKLVLAFAGMVGDALKSSDAVQASNLVVSIMETKALWSEEDQAALADSVKLLCGIEAKLKAELKRITAPLDEARAAATDLARPQLSQIASAIERAKSLDASWRNEVERIAQERARAAQAAAAEAARLAAATAEQSGYAPPPPAVEEAVAAPSVARGGVGKSYSRRTPKAQGVDKAKIAAHPDFAYLLTFDSTKAVAEFRVRVNQVGEERAVADFEAAGIRITFESSTVFA